MKKFFLLTLMVGLLGTIVLYQGYSSAIRYALNPDGSARIAISVPEGATGSDVAELLYEKRLISQVSAFNFYLRQNELSHLLKAGRYVFLESYDLPKIVEIMVAGQSSEVVVTLLEGWTARQIAEKLETEGLTTTDAFMDCLKTCDFDYEFLPDDFLEGYLYPDTYFVNPGSYTNEAFLNRLIKTFRDKLSEEDWFAVSKSSRSLEQIVIMASIVEREERREAEKATVAGILWNRFEAGVGLGADATVLYGLGRTSGGLSRGDLQSNSPFNTRKFAGLPPTPISNPSISSIRAALYPSKTEYWYYLHDQEGGIHYGKTLEEHNVNKARYIR